MARPTFRRNPPVKAAAKVEAEKPKRKRKAKQDDE